MQEGKDKLWSKEFNLINQLEEVHHSPLQLLEEVDNISPAHSFW